MLRKPLPDLGAAIAPFLGQLWARELRACQRRIFEAVA